jgi:hypothetical protein
MVSEHIHQKALIEWWSNAHKSFGLPECALLAIPNGGQRHPAVAAKLRAEGVRKGICDLVLPVARQGFHSLWVEMKFGKNKPTKEQAEFIRWQQEEGSKCVVCYDWLDAKQEIENYLKGQQ